MNTGPWAPVRCLGAIGVGLVFMGVAMAGGGFMFKSGADNPSFQDDFFKSHNEYVTVYISIVSSRSTSK